MERTEQRKRIQTRRQAQTALELVSNAEARVGVLEVTLKTRETELKQATEALDLEEQQHEQTREELQRQVNEANARTMDAMCETDEWIDKACRADDACRKWRAGFLVALLLAAAALVLALAPGLVYAPVHVDRIDAAGVQQVKNAAPASHPATLSGGAR